MARHKRPGPTDRELAILSVLWSQGPSTVRAVHEALHPDSQTGYTTTLKLMQIMAEKGLLTRKGAGRQHIWVCPSLDLVVAQSPGPFEDQRELGEGLLGRVVGALVD